MAAHSSASYHSNHYTAPHHSYQHGQVSPPPPPHSRGYHTSPMDRYGAYDQSTDASSFPANFPATGGQGREGRDFGRLSSSSRGGGGGGGGGGEGMISSLPRYSEQKQPYSFPMAKPPLEGSQLSSLNNCERERSPEKFEKWSQTASGRSRRPANEVSAGYHSSFDSEGDSKLSHHHQPPSSSSPSFLHGPLPQSSPPSFSEAPPSPRASQRERSPLSPSPLLNRATDDGCHGLIKSSPPSLSSEPYGGAPPREKSPYAPSHHHIVTATDGLLPDTSPQRREASLYSPSPEAASDGKRYGLPRSSPPSLVESPPTPSPQEGPSLSHPHHHHPHHHRLQMNEEEGRAFPKSSPPSLLSEPDGGPQRPYQDSRSRVGTDRLVQGQGQHPRSSPSSLLSEPPPDASPQRFAQRPAQDSWSRDRPVHGQLPRSSPPSLEGTSVDCDPAHHPVPAHHMPLHLQHDALGKPPHYSAPTTSAYRDSTAGGGVASYSSSSSSPPRQVRGQQQRSQSDRQLRIPTSSRPPLQPSHSDIAIQSAASHASSMTKTGAGAGPHSEATLENERYSLDELHRPDHHNEDRSFVVRERDYRVFAVFDGHDGQRAAGFASNYMYQLFQTTSWSSVVAKASSNLLCEALGEFFKATDKDFFQSIQEFVEEKESLQRSIPQVCVRACVYVCVCVCACSVCTYVCVCVCACSVKGGAMVR